MALEDIKTGSVIACEYLWRREALAGQVEGIKRRHCAVAVRVPGQLHDMIYLMPLTTKMPDTDTLSVEVPQIEKKRSGLDPDIRQWVVLQELNVDIIPGSFVLEPDAVLGSFSKAFFQSVLRVWKQNFSRTALTKRR